MNRVLNDIKFFDNLASNHSHHAHSDRWWMNLDSSLNREREALHKDLSAGRVELGPLRDVRFTFFDMGAISSVDLFGLDELIIFAFYWVNRNRYRFIVDMGANIGLHSVVLGLMGYEVRAYEPDPRHVEILQGHLEVAGVSKLVRVHEAAIAPEEGALEFIRVLGNTTGSHVLGAKDSPYGDLETFEVAAVAVQNVIVNADLVKMDVEGLESDLLESLTASDLANTDLLCEVGTKSNAQRIWHHFKDTEVNLFSQKTGWQKSRSASDVPTSYREGTLFVSSRDEMPWQPTGDHK